MPGGRITKAQFLHLPHLVYGIGQDRQLNLADQYLEQTGVERRIDVTPETLKGEQRALYDDMKKGIETSFKGFKAIDESGSLIGPWNPWLTFPQFGGAVWNYTKAMATDPKLPKSVREVAILVTGTHFHSGYELYAHTLVGETRGLSDETIATIVSGEKPTVLSKEEAMTYDFASALVSGRIVPKLLYDQTQSAFGRDGIAELIYLVGLYCAVSVVLNGFDVPVPE